MTTVDIIKPFFFIVFLLIEIKPLSKTLSLNLFFLFCSVCARVLLSGANFNATFPFPQVFSLSPFPLKKEPTVTAWRGTTLGRDITHAISLIVPLRFMRRLRNNMAQSLVLYVKSDARYGRRLAAPIPSSKSHNPFISALRIGFLLVAKGRLCDKFVAKLACSARFFLQRWLASLAVLFVFKLVAKVFRMRLHAFA